MRSVLTAIAALALPLAGTASAAPGAFTTEEAAWCGAIFARMTTAMQGAEGVPPAMLQQAEIGLMVWEYELVASAPGKQEHAERAVLGAIDRLADEMPQGDTEEVANARGEFLLTRAQGCMERIEGIYTNGPHPIIQRIVARNEAADQPAELPAPAASEPRPRRKGLR